MIKIFYGTQGSGKTTLANDYLARKKYETYYGHLSEDDLKLHNDRLISQFPHSINKDELSILLQCNVTELSESIGNFLHIQKEYDWSILLVIEVQASSLDFLMKFLEFVDIDNIEYFNANQLNRDFLNPYLI